VTTPEPVEAEQGKLLERAQAYEQLMMRNFQMELGRLSGQSIVDKTNFAQKEADWEAERKTLTETIEALSERLIALEAAFPAEPPSPPREFPPAPEPTRTPKPQKGVPKKGRGR
jgi:hypothetical protein